uniref:Peptidase S26 domain-containing protein n=1 Tax=Pan paniscus TaxID=9597 RepID=A0A2R9BRM0_PANPA
MLCDVLGKGFRLVGYAIQYGYIVYVPVGHVWLEGDNLQNSTDSRYYGPIPYQLIRGRIFFKIWPLSDFEFLRASSNGHRFSDDW